MQYTAAHAHLRVEIQAKECTIPPDERARMQALLAPVYEAVHNFPSSELWIKIIHHPRSSTFHAEFKLKLPGRTLLTGATESYLDTAFARGLRKLLNRLKAYQANPD